MKAKVLPLVVIVENDIAVSKGVMDELLRLDYCVWMMSDFEGVLHAIHNEETRQIVLFIDHKVPALLKILRYVKTQVRHRVVVFVWGSCPTIDMKKVAMVKHKAYDVLDKDRVGLDELVLYVKRGQMYLDDLSQSDKDPMTGLDSLRTFSRTVETKLRTAYDRGNPKGVFSIIFFDLDDFKNINDTYGHPTGNKAIKEAAKIIRKHIRSSDDACRYGGDESIVFLSQVGEAEATRIAKEIQEAISACRVGALGIRISISFGVAELRQKDIEKDVEKSLESLVSSADSRLLEAKSLLDDEEVDEKIEEKIA